MGAQQRTRGRWQTPLTARGLCLLVVFRLLNSLLVQTYFDPDEFWQSIEVAHRIVFGYGFLTWEWERGLRGYLHPLLFAGVLAPLRLLGIDSGLLVVWLPRLLQCGFAVVGDVHVFLLARKLFGEGSARWALFAHLVNWFVWYTSVRTYSNSLEAVLTVVALYHWPLLPSRSSWSESRLVVALALAAACVVIRPTSAIVWALVSLVHLGTSPSPFALLLKCFAPVAVVGLGASVALDSTLHGRPVFVLWNFLEFNLLQGGGSFYGTHPWHWYASCGLPTVLFSFLPFAVHGARLVVSQHHPARVVVAVVVWACVVLSLPAHKEFRFLCPVLPLALILAGHSLHTLHLGAREKTAPSSGRSAGNPRRTFAVLGLTPGAMVKGLCVSNLVLCVYFGLVHQRGVVDVVHHLRSLPQCNAGEVSGTPNSECLSGAIFLMPCHSTPFYAYLHRDVPLINLDCSPTKGVRGELESDRFVNSPASFTTALFEERPWTPSAAPSHVVFFDDVDAEVRPVLQRLGFEQRASFFHSVAPSSRNDELYFQGRVFLFGRA